MCSYIIELVLLQTSSASATEAQVSKESSVPKAEEMLQPLYVLSIQSTGQRLYIYFVSPQGRVHHFFMSTCISLFLLLISSTISPYAQQNNKQINSICMNTSIILSNKHVRSSTKLVDEIFIYCNPSTHPFFCYI